MHGYDSTTFGDRMVDYDTLDWALEIDQAPASAFLADLAPGGTALELGIGTGRVALPLAERGVRIVGIEASPSMADQLTNKLDGHKGIEVVVGDFVDTPAEGTFDVAFCVNHTFFLLRTQEEQVRCFANVAARLAPHGAFVLQTFVPDAADFGREQITNTMQVGLHHAVVSAAVHDRVTQRVDAQRMMVTENGIRLYPLAYRYVWPSELDLMARLAGLRLAERWDTWTRRPYTARSIYVSVYRHAGES